jgi:hypothetical protein
MWFSKSSRRYSGLRDSSPTVIAYSFNVEGRLYVPDSSSCWPCSTSALDESASPTTSSFGRRSLKELSFEISLVIVALQTTFLRSGLAIAKPILDKTCSGAGISL